MAISITEKILSNNKLYTDNYLQAITCLVKSISIVNKNEAARYNDYITKTYPTVPIDKTDRATWRYYLHLSGQQHIVDEPVTIVSEDNGDTITLSRDTLALHRITRKKLLKFGLYYKELIDRFPEQELYVKAIIATSTPLTIQEIIDAEDYHIVSYDDDRVEENEDDLIPSLQVKIDNYKNISLIPYYMASDDLFLASQYHILYYFIFTSILAIRLKNAKTLRAHSYHVINYLSSHHYLDAYYQYLTTKQALFLYRNLLYLDNHAGREDIFRLLIDKLFTDRSITVVNYTHSQSNGLDDDYYLKYKFKQKLLNNADLPYSDNDFTLDDIRIKESSLAPSNPDEYKYNFNRIDFKLKNALFNSLLTKDLETVIYDNTDVVKYKLVPTIVDYWAYLLKANKIRYLVTVLDPVSNKELRLNTADLFKLYTLSNYKLNNIELSTFPDYTIKRVYKPVLPTADTLLSVFYRKYYWHKEALNTILHYVPPYTTAISSYQFEQSISYIYKLNIGIWLYTSNLSDKDTNGQIENAVSNMHMSDTYNYGGETAIDFLTRIGMADLYTYDEQSLATLSFSILNGLYDNKLTFLNKYKYIQKAMIEVFKNFNSYTIQMINTYNIDSPVLCGPKDRRVVVDQDRHTVEYFCNEYIPNVEIKYKTTDTADVNLDIDVAAGYSYHSNLAVDLTSDLYVDSSTSSYVFINLGHSLLNSVSITTTPAQPSSEDNLMFLALNL